MKSFYIPSESMLPTLQVNDNILVNRLTPSFSPLQQGDIIVFKDTQQWMGTPFDVNPNPSLLEIISNTLMLSEPADKTHLIKRVIGLPNQKVECCDADGKITVNGKPLTEPYLADDVEPSLVEFSVTVPQGKVWVMGDNRVNSSDSRYNQDKNDGFINYEDIIGKAAVRTLPFERFAWL